MTILDAIVDKKRERLQESKERLQLSELKGYIVQAGEPRDFVTAIRRGPEEEGGIKLIAEAKKASPSMGPIRAEYDPWRIGEIYRSTADAVSVLTEEDFFLGDIKHMATVRESSGLPAMRKDFLIDPWQMYESRAAGADAVLLIADILNLALAMEMLDVAYELDLAVVFEAHDKAGLEMALEAGAPIIGINNRNLKTFKVDIGTTLLLKDMIPDGIFVISESGITTREDVKTLDKAGVDAVLVGTALMQSDDIGGKARELMGR